MGVLSRALERKASDPLALWAEIARAGRSSKAGPTVNLETALRVATFFACLRVISQGVAQVPFKLYRETQQGDVTKILPERGHSVYQRLATKANDWQTAFEFREQQVIHAALGNAYAWINRTIMGVSELIPLDPARMCVEQSSEFHAPVYKYTSRDGQTVPLPANQIWHLRGPSWTGFAGMDMLSVARDALGLSIALDDSVAGLHANGVRPSGLYSVDGNLDEKQHAKLTAWLKKEAATPGAPMVLDRGAKWLSTVMSSVDAQHKEMRDHQIAEVCRFMGVSPHMIGHTDKTSTYASAEQFAIQHVVHCLSPWYARIEQSADVALLKEKERSSGLYTKHNANGLMRGSVKDRAEYYAKALGSGGTQGWLKPNEVRALDEFNPVDDEVANKLPTPTSSKPPEPAPAA